MRGTITVLLAGLLLPVLSAGDSSTAPKQQLEALKKEVEKARQDYHLAFSKAKTDRERQQLQDSYDKQIQACARRALELARKHPRDPVAVDALSWIISGGLGYQGAGAEIETAIDLLRTQYATSDKIRDVCASVFVGSGISTKPEALLRAVVEKNPSRDIRAVATFTLARVLRRRSATARLMRDPAVAKRAEQGLAVLRGAKAAEVLKYYKDSDPDKLLQEAEALLDEVIRKYGDVKSSRSTFGEEARAMLFEMRHLVVGKPAPEVEGEDIDGQRFKLSDYRGKVVVLDFWGHW